MDVRQVALDWGQSWASPSYPWRGGCMGVGGGGLEEFTFPVDGVWVEWLVLRNLPFLWM